MFHLILHFGQRYKEYRCIRVFVKWILKIVYQCEIPLSCAIDDSVYFYHSGFGIVINPNAVIRKGVKIQHGVTIGTRKGRKAPYIGRNVFIGAKASIIGDIRIGDNAKIGAGAVVVCDVPANCTVVGVPARIISKGV